MSGGGQIGIGQQLREAREAQGLQIDTVAARLRLMHRQIEAMEADDFEALGRPVFARGFVRNYARLLGLDPEALLERMEGPRPDQPARRPEPPLPRSWFTSPWLLLLLTALLLAVTGPIALYWWLNSGEDEWAGKTPAVVKIEPIPLPVPAVEPAEGSAEPALPSPVSDAPAESAPAEAPPAAAPTAEQEHSGTLVTGVLNFEFADESWVEIRDGSGRVIHRQLNPAGSRVEVRGQPPFRLLVGNAAQARMTYNGRPIDLKPFIDVTVARFTLEE